MSISPRQNFLKPPPVPEMPTVTLTLPFDRLLNSSATASVSREDGARTVDLSPSTSSPNSRRASGAVAGSFPLSTASGDERPMASENRSDDGSLVDQCA